LLIDSAENRNFIAVILFCNMRREESTAAEVRDIKMSDSRGGGGGPPGESGDFLNKDQV
jgi:hypothetical protein